MIQAACWRPYADVMGGEPETPARRRGQISVRLDEIRARIRELGDGPHAGADSAADRLIAAQRSAAVSLAAAEQAFAASIDAFRRAAEAHNHLATMYERSIRPGNAGENSQLAAFHRAAAAADSDRADRAQACLAATQAAHDAR